LETLSVADLRRTEAIESDLWALATAIESGFLPLPDVVAWADRLILELEAPRSWLLDLCLAKSKEQASATVWMEWNLASELAGTIEHADPCWEDVYLGFLYRQHERGSLTMSELLEQAGRFSDAYGSSHVDCESFYYLLNEIDGGGPTIPSNRPLAERVAELFAPMVESTRQYLRLLPEDLRERDRPSPYSR
jgi:hypothetical protein